MRSCIFPLLLLFINISQNIRLVTCSTSPIKGRSDKGENIKGRSGKGEPSKTGPSKEEPSKRDSSDEEPGPCKKQKICDNLPVEVYPKRILLGANSKSKCENERVKNRKPPSFWINRDPPKPETDLLSVFKYRFVATFERSLPNEAQPLAYLNANKGHCNDLRTYTGNKNCGMARSLLIHCVQDEKVIENGGLNPQTDGAWTDQDSVSIATENCKTIVLISCAVRESTPDAACKMYMETAIDAGYQMMFIEKEASIVDEDEDLEKYKIFNVKNAILELGKNPEKFVKETGKHWFFCKCKPTRQQECLGLDTA